MHMPAIAGKMLNRISRLNYQKKIMLIILMFTLLPLLVYGPLYLVRAWNSRVDEVVGINREKLRSGVYNVNNLLVSGCVDISYITDNSELNTILTTDPKEDFDNVYEAYHIVREILMPRTQMNGYINNSVNVYAFDNYIYNGEYSQRMELLDVSIKNEVLNTKNGDIVWRLCSPADSGNNRGGYIGIYKLISSIDKPLGIVEIRIPFKNILDSFESDLPEQAFIAYTTADNKGNTIIKGNYIGYQAEAGKILMNYLKTGNKGQYYIISEKININSDSIIMFIPKYYIFSKLKGSIIFSIIILAIIITAIVFSIKITAIMATKRLTSLMSQIDVNIEKLVEDGQLKLMEGNDEFSKIDKRFFELLNRIKDYYHKLNVSELDKKALELMLLQERINPHLLYNSLSSIKWAFPNETLENVVDAMVKYYRICLNKGNEVLKVRQEVDMIMEYVNIQRFAYRLDIIYDVDIDEEVMNCVILKHTLQPIVENAILHGINGLKKGGILRIIGRMEGNSILLSIEDNGVGMSQDKVNQILNQNYQSLYGGYGIKNMARRLDAYFGDKFNLDITSEVGRGTTVSLILPIIKDERLLM